MDRLSFDTSLAKNLPALPVRAHSENLAANALLAIWRRRYLVLFVVMLSLLAGFGVLSLLERKYAADAVVQLDPSRREGTFGPEQAPAVMLDASALIHSEARIIRSRPIARRVVERLGLAEDPAFAIDAPGLAHHLAWVAAMGAEAFAWARGEEAPAQVEPAATPDAEIKDARLARVVAELIRNVSVSADSRSYLITITYTSGDPVASARIANAFAEEYLQRRMQANINAASRTSDWLAGQIRDASAALREAEAAIAAFRERTGMLEAGGADAGGDAENVQQQQLRALTSQFNAASLTRLNEERRLARVQDLLRTGRHHAAPRRAFLRLSGASGVSTGRSGRSRTVFRIRTWPRRSTS